MMATELNQTIQKPENQQLIDLVRDLFSHEIVWYADQQTADLVGLTLDVYNSADLQSVGLQSPKRRQSAAERPECRRPRRDQAIVEQSRQTEDSDHRVGVQTYRRRSRESAIGPVGKSGRRGHRRESRPQRPFSAINHRRQRLSDAQARRQDDPVGRDSRRRRRRRGKAGPTQASRRSAEAHSKW